MEKRELFYTVGGSVPLCNHYGEYHGGSLKKLGLAFPHLGTGPEKILNQKDKRTPVFTGALFTIARTWKQSCPLTDDNKEYSICCGSDHEFLIAKFRLEESKENH